MAKRRTKSQKKRARSKRRGASGSQVKAKKSVEHASQGKPATNLTYKIDDDKLLELEKNEVESKIKVPDLSLFEYDPKLLVGDIRKTLLLSGFILACELVLFIYLR